MLKESNKSRFDSYSVGQCIDHICHVTFRDCRVYIFPTTFLYIAGNLPKNSDIKAWGLYFFKGPRFRGRIYREQFAFENRPSLYSERNLRLKID